MPTIELIDRAGCPLCSSREIKEHIRFKDIPVVRCQQCGFLYSSKLMSDDALKAYYANNFGSQRHLRGQMVNAKVNHWALDMLLDLDSIKNLLDVGTGYGFLLKELQDKNSIKACGVELSRQESAFGKENLSLDIHNVLLSESGLEKNSFDAVTSFEVIEHIPEPVNFVKEVMQYLKPGGWLVTMTDNFESDVVKSLGAGFPKWIPHSHICHFSPATLEKTISDAGLNVKKYLSYTPWELYLRKLYYQLRGIEIAADNAFELSSTLENEMGGKFRYFYARNIVNKTWARLTASKNPNGALMYMLAQK